MQFLIINPTATIGGVMPCKEAEFPMEYSEIETLKKELGIREHYIGAVNFRENFSKSAISFDELNGIVKKFENDEADYRFVYENFEFKNPIEMAEFLWNFETEFDGEKIAECINENVGIMEYVDYVAAMKSQFKNEFSELRKEKSISEICELSNAIDSWGENLINAIIEAELADDLFEAVEYAKENELSLDEDDDAEDTYITDEVDNQLQNLPSWMVDCIDVYVPSNAWNDYCDIEEDFDEEIYKTSYGLLVVK